MPTQLLSQKTVKIIWSTIVIVMVIAVVFIIIKRSPSFSEETYTSTSSLANEHLIARGFRVAKEAALPPSFTCDIPNTVRTIASSTYYVVCKTSASTFPDKTRVAIAWKSNSISSKEWTGMVAKEVLLSTGNTTKGTFSCEKDVKLKGGLQGERRFCTVTSADRKSYFFAEYFFSSGNSQNGRYVLYSYNTAADYKIPTIHNLLKQTFDRLAQNFFIYIPKQQKTSSFFNFVQMVYAQDAGGDGDGSGDAATGEGATGGETGDTGSVPSNPDDRGGAEEATPAYVPPACIAPRYLVADWYCQVTFDGETSTTLTLGTLTQINQTEAQSQCLAAAASYQGWTPSVQIITNSGQCVQSGAAPAVNLNFSLSSFFERVSASK